MSAAPPPPVPRKPLFRSLARLVWCGLGAAAGIGAAVWSDTATSPYLLASLGGSTVFLFALTRTAPAQPRALFGGHLGSAMIGICCYQWLGDSLGIYILAMVLTLVYMLATRTLHPPAGANALIMIHEHADFASLLHPVGLGIAILAAVAAVWSRIFPGTYRYPVDWFEKSPPSFLAGCWKE